MKTVRQRSKGPEVEILQHLLKYHGHNLKADGDFGPGTKKAVISFQSKNFDSKGHPLAPDGIVGSGTWRSLIEAEKKPKALKAPAKDNLTAKRIKTIHPELVKELEDVYEEIRNRGVSVRFTQVYRTLKEQDELYAKGRTAPGPIVTNARGGQSYHNYGLAVDVVLLTGGGRVSWDRDLDQNSDGKKDWDEIVFVFKHFGWKWGGDWRSFKDYPHFEKSFGHSTRELKRRYDKKEFVKGSYVRLS